MCRSVFVNTEEWREGGREGGRGREKGKRMDMLHHRAPSLRQVHVYTCTRSYQHQQNPLAQCVLPTNVRTALIPAVVKKRAQFEATYM